MKFKIPTILGLAMLFTAIILGVMLFKNNQEQLGNKRELFKPKNIRVVNLTDNQATIIWQTENPVEGSIIYGQSLNLNKTAPDDRNSSEPKKHLSHFVTLRNLSPNTKYYYKMKFPAISLPDLPLDFKTATEIPQAQKENKSFLSPLRGLIVSNNLTPVDDSLVFLKTEGSSNLATYTSSSGNFLLPMQNLRTKDLVNLYSISTDPSLKTQATLQIIKGSQQSSIKFNLPFANQTLPPLTLGQNLDLTNFESIAQKQLAPTGFDLNDDGRVNTLDLSLILQNQGNNFKNPKTDLNKDGKVDQTDVELIRKSLK